MAGPVTQWLSADHERLGELLDRSLSDPAAYDEFRRGLLRHIGMEEKVLLPAARRARGGEPLPSAARLRLDHGAIAALLVPPLSPAIRAALRGILERHNVLEEGPEGVYAQCERMAGDEAAALLESLRSYPDVPVNPHVDLGIALEAAVRALARAGYTFEEFGG